MTVGLGEIGLDWTEPESSWDKQEEVFRRLLQYACVGRVLVLHLRSKNSHDSTIYHKGLEMVKEYCAVRQPIHHHCFGGNSQVVSAWSSALPNCYFGFTANVSSLGPEKLSAVWNFCV
ncbi:uncharacterized protein LOC123558360 [Mercenaria mercenaria]|uniref:uncharacterized protein LOC123558360 n=1 Tax=Mercenaria mercenaria TaxID=6596 RepID=UPI00234E7F54|nr:uncharacterized protein LOC123558360 [Mercenaria mercenaria]